MKSKPKSLKPKSLRIRVRPARRGDLDALMELERRVFATDRLTRQSMRNLLASASATVIIAEEKGRLAGAAVVLFRSRATVARLYSIAVLPAMSGKGVACALLAMAERGAAARKCRCVRLEVHERNRKAIALYRKSGYRQFGCHSEYYDDGGDALRFEKPVGAVGKARR
jgi:ribosomal protein S18 acetylase RimI-like enzyme